MPAEPPEQPEVVDPPMVPFAIGGMVIWALAGLVLLLFCRGWLAAHGHENWLWTCLAGFLIGLPGLAVMRRYDAHRARRRADPDPQPR
ncbi:DUF2530 domain-containing protein [Plantactinospora siamensis]|uniref:DUF2530 domain-containing protein n=1 Tax=Plantactinospora siamensis TaxID=555372 RepID=A0ABV6NWY4_9ACTN